MGLTVGYIIRWSTSQVMRGIGYLGSLVVLVGV